MENIEGNFTGVEETKLYFQAWIPEKDLKTGQYRRIRIPRKRKSGNKICRIIDQIYMKIEQGIIPQPMSGGEIYYPGEMVKHDRSMMAFKTFLDDNKIHFFIRLDENKGNSKQKVKIERASVAKEARKRGIDFLPETRGADGFIRYGTNNFVVDWELRRDWVTNINNIPIRYEQRKKIYYGVAYPPPNPGEPRKKLSPNYQDLADVKDFIINEKLSHPTPYFIYRTLGQFSRKINKPQIVLSIQCNQASPQWPNTPKITKEGLFTVAWHEDFQFASKVTRTTQSGVGEHGGYSECQDFGIFSFDHKGISLFKTILNRQIKSGMIKDKNGNYIPKNRKW